MPPIRGRASEACLACRKQKTRCYDSAAGACLRCQRLRLPCSLSPETLDDNTIPVAGSMQEIGDIGTRLARLERVVENVVERLDTATGFRNHRAPDASRSYVIQRVNSEHTVIEENESLAAPVSTRHSEIRAAGPVFVIKDVVNEVGLERPSHRVLGRPESVALDIIGKGMITAAEAIDLLTLFNLHYTRWVSFKDVSAENLLQDLRSSPLLLCACCLIAVRHTSEEQAARLAPQLFQEARSLLSTGLLDVPQPFAFFRASLILSLWSTTIDQVLLGIDSWLSSGFALQHTFASDIFSHILHGTYPMSQPSKDEFSRWCVWNNLCLVHLHYSVGTRRKPLLDRAQIERCRQVLESDHATNFEYRMVAEITLYWIIYESCSKDSMDLPKTQAELHSWKQEWKFLFDQPRSQFVQMGFHFAQLLIFDQSLKARSAAVRESLISEMIRLSSDILHLAMNTTDDRTRHLTDHIYHVITFAAVTLCRLLHVYEEQLSSSHDIMELDQLVLNLVTWLHSIGLPCHAAHTLGDVVAAFHKKLRPDARPAPSREEVDFWNQPEFSNFFPELLGIEVWEGSNYPLPDWEPYNAE